MKNIKHILGRCDLHTHTKFSFDGAKDGSGEPAAVAKAALDAGLSAIALTDHCDIDDIIEGIYPTYPADEIFREVERVKSDFDGKLSILRGIELGEPHVYPAEARKLLSEQNYDFVLGSLHNLRGYPDFYFLKFDRMEQLQIDYLVRRAISEQLEIVNFEWNGRHIDSLAHITYIGRYLDECGASCDFLRFEPEWRRLFHAMIENDVALELNTSGLRKGGRLMPTPELVKLYIDCGGKRFTLGSDAHTARDVGKNLADAAELLPESSLRLLQIRLLPEGMSAAAGSSR